MEVEDGVLGVIHGLPSSGLAITLLCTNPFNRQVFRSTSSTKSRIPVKVKRFSCKRHQNPTARDSVENNKNNMKKSKNVDILLRYIFKSRAVDSSNPKMCPKLKKRLEEHRKQCHLNVSYTKIKPDILVTPVTPVTSKLQLNQQSKLNIKMNENSNCCQLNEEHNNEDENGTEMLNSISSDDASTVPLRNTVTYDVVSLRSKKIYEASLREEITKWLQNILSYFYKTHSMEIETEKIIERLISKLLNFNINDKNYENDVGREIEKTLHCLNILKKTSNASNENTYDNGVIDNFMQRLRRINSLNFEETLLTKTCAEDNNSQKNTNLSKNKDNNKNYSDICVIDIEKNITSKDEAQNYKKGSIENERYTENLDTDKEINENSSKSVRDALINNLLNNQRKSTGEIRQKYSEHDFKINEEESGQSKLKIEELYKNKTNCLKSDGKTQSNTESLVITRKTLKTEMKMNQDHLEVFAANSCCRPPGSSEPCTSLDDDNSNAMKDVVTKFIQYKDEVDDPIAANAIGKLLENEVSILNNQSVNQGSNETEQLSAPEKLGKQLHYIKIISDWIKDTPMDESFNTTKNIQRAEFVIDLSQELSNVEEVTPCSCTFEDKAREIITESMKKLPILDKNPKHIIHATEDLLKNIADHKHKCSYCGLSDTEHDVVSNETSGLNEQNLADFLEEYIRIHGSDIDDELKLEAWVTRLIQEIKIILQNTSKPTKGACYNALADVPVPDDESVRIFGLKLGYAKEISDWLRNLSLQSVQSQQDNEALVSMVCNLAEKMAARERKIMANPNDTKADSELNSYIDNWVHELPLVSTQEMAKSVVLTQLKNRMERVNKEDLKINSYIEYQNKLNSKDLSKVKDKSKPSNTQRLPSSKNKTKSQLCTSPSCQTKPRNPDQLLVEFIEKWTNDLPIKGKDEVKTLKNNTAKEIFQEIDKLNLSLGSRDNDLYEELLSGKVNVILHNLRDYPEVKKKKEKLKNDFIKKVMNYKNLIDEKNAGDIYKRDLENTIETSMPISVVSTDPGLQLYKTNLAKMFIIQNFDNSDEPIKTKYEKRIRADLDKYTQDVYRNNNVPLTNDQIYNELYRSLFAVPMSNFSLQNKVEQIKTRVEIDTWLDEIPTKETNDMCEIFHRDQILDTLAVRLREMELNNDKDEVIHKEIVKILAKLPLKTGKEANLDDYADRLQCKLKSSTETRKCFTVNNNAKIKSLTNKKNKNLTDFVPDVSARSDNRECCPKSTPIAYKNTADIIEETVDSWCRDLPLKFDTEEEELNIKRQILTRIITIVSELNANSKALHNDCFYCQQLDGELDKILTNLTFYCNRHECKGLRKQSLIKDLNIIKIPIRNEVIRQEYRQELNKTVEDFLNKGSIKPQDSFTKKRVTEDIVDNFIEYSYNKEDIDSQMLPKVQIQNALMKYQEQATGSGNAAKDPLIKRNKLITELTKVESPDESLIRDEILEVRMKTEVSDFLNAFEFNCQHEEIIHEIRNIMAKRLNDIESVGHNCATREQMKKEIDKSLKKICINFDNNSKLIENFIDKLKNTEDARKTHSAKMKNDVKESKVYCKRMSSQIDSRDTDNVMPSSKNKEQYFPNTKYRSSQGSGSELKMLKSDARLSRPSIDSKPRKSSSGFDEAEQMSWTGCKSRHSLDVDVDEEINEAIAMSQNEYLNRNNSCCQKPKCAASVKDARTICPQCGLTMTEIEENSDDDVCMHCESKKRTTHCECKHLQ